MVQTKCQVLGKEIFSNDRERGISTRVTAEMFEWHEFGDRTEAGSGHQDPRTIVATRPCFSIEDRA